MAIIFLDAYMQAKCSEPTLTEKLQKVRYQVIIILYHHFDILLGKAEYAI